MKLLFYIDWRAFNIGRRKGYFLEEIVLLMSVKLIAVIGCVIILTEHFCNLEIRKHLFNPRSENAPERVLAIITILGACFLIFKTLKGYYASGNYYQDVIKKYDAKYKKANPYIFLTLFLLVTFLCFFSLWFAGILIKTI